MRKLLALSIAAAALFVVAVAAPAGAADRKADGLRNDQALQTDMSARRKHRRHVRRYYGPRYRYYGGPYYYPYGYYPYRYYPYGYYRRPGIYLHFGF